jgi:4-amino-4-deoxychorismate lyase
LPEWGVQMALPPDRSEFQAQTYDRRDPLLADAGPDVGIIETLRASNGTAPRIGRHIARMSETAARLGYAFDPGAIPAALRKLPPGVWRVRLCLTRDGLRCDHAPLPGAVAIMRVCVAGARLRPDDPWLGVKTTRRALYDQVRASLPDNVHEAIFLNSRGELCEGTITNLFVQIGARLLTPAVGCGLLRGTLRAEMLDAGEAEEAVLHLDDLAAARAFFVGNSLRGLCPAKLVGPAAT